jgi:DNA-binding IclR family transcriptional regulator
LPTLFDWYRPVQWVIMENPDSTRQSAPAVRRSIRLLNLLRGTRDPMTLSELSHRLGIVPSTCLHILRALTDEGLVTFDPAGKRYRLGLGLLSYTASVLRQNPFAHNVQPVLDGFARQHKATTFAIERRSVQDLMVVAVSDTPKPFSLQVVVGTTFPALASASGRCVAALTELGDAERRRLFQQLKWQRPPTFEDWLDEVNSARENGYGLDRGNFVRGATIVSVPVAGGMGPAGRFLAAVGITEQFDPGGAERLANVLKAEAKAFENKLANLAL